MQDEIVEAHFDNGTKGLRKKSWCVRTDTAYRLLANQPLTPKEQRDLKRERLAAEQEIADRNAVTAIFKRGTFSGKSWSEDRGIGGGKVHLSAKEKKSLERFIGQPVDDAQHARRLMKAKGMRFLEKGEKSERIIQANIDYAERGGEARGEAIPEEFHLRNDDLGFVEKVKPFDFAGRLAYHRARLGEHA